MSIRKYLLTLLLLSLAPASRAQSLATLALPNQQSILNERAFFMFPAAAVNSARATDIMAADPNANKETRLVFDSGDMRLVFFAQELFQLADTAQLRRTITAADQRTATRTTVLAKTAGLFAVLSTPSTFDAKANAILINSLVVRTADNSLFSIAAYVNAAGLKKQPEFTALTTRVFQTLTAGTRINNRAARVEAVPVFGGKKKLLVPLPADFTVTVDQKYDFQVLRFQRYAPYGTEKEGTFLLYLGHHPSFFYGEFGFKAAQAQTVAGNFLGKPVSLMQFHDEGRKIYIREQQVPGDAIADGLVVHLGMLSPSPAQLDEFSAIAAGIKVQ